MSLTPNNFCELLGIKGAKRVFKTRAAQERFNEDFSRQIEPKLKCLRRARQQNEIEAMFRFVD
jgi:hypothetical protein